jgi:hypothetical protein
MFQSQSTTKSVGVQSKYATNLVFDQKVTEPGNLQGPGQTSPAILSFPYAPLPLLVSLEISRVKTIFHENTRQIRMSSPKTP